MLSCCLWMDERNHRPTKQQVENCRKECQEHWQGLRELCWKFTVDVLEWGECQHTHLPGCLGGVNAFPSTAALNSFAFLHFLVFARSFAPYREERWPRSSKNPRLFKSIHLPETDIASPWVLKGESSFGALPLRLVVIAHVLISTLIWLNPQPQRNQLRETCLLLNLRAAAVQKTKPSQIPWEKKMEASGLSKSLWRGESLALLCSRVLEPAPGDLQTPLWLRVLCKHTRPVPEVKPGFGWVFILVPSAS